MVDKYNKLPLVRSSIIVQKVATVLAYLSFMIMLSEPTNEANPFNPYYRRYTKSPTSFATPTFFFLVASSCALHLSNTTISIAIERDWATCIAQGPYFSVKLARLNTYLRQINLLCKLCAPLFVSFLTVSLDHSHTAANETTHSILSVKVLAIATTASLFFELYWIGIVYRRFPVLEIEQRRIEGQREAPSIAEEIEEEVEELVPPPPPVQTTNYIERLLNIPDWRELVRLPIFFSSLAISLLYLTVLSYVSSTPLSLSFLIGHIYSFDGIMVGYLKTISYSDDFIAEMRGICVITGLIGTALALPLEKKIGSVRAGNWSIW